MAMRITGEDNNASYSEAKVVSGGLSTTPAKTVTAPAAAPVTVDATSGGTVIVAANVNRLGLMLQNVGTEPCLIRLGGNPSATAYNYVLSKDSGAKVGAGGSLILDNWRGAVKGITEANSTVIAVTELA